MSLGASARDTVEAVARGSYGKLVAYLASTTGDLAAAEDAMGDALVAALITWQRQGVPDRPESWLLTAARRNLIDAVRRTDVARRALPEMARAIEERSQLEASSALPDRRLHLMFACAHPAIDRSMHSPLMLQVVLGLDATRIAEAFLMPAATMSQRLVRVKAKIKQAGIPLVLPERHQLAVRLEAVLDAVYGAYGLVWDDGADGADRSDDRALRDEAIWLARLLVALLPEEPESNGLLALILGIEARRGARRDDNGRYVPLDEQDPARWSVDLILEAEDHLRTAKGLGRTGPFQLHAAIQSVHNQRAVTGRTHSAAVARLYDGLATLHPSIGVLVARAAAYRTASGATHALDLLDALPTDVVDGYQPYWAVRAHCLQSLGHADDARKAFDRAIALSRDPSVVAHLRRHRPPQ